MRIRHLGIRNFRGIETLDWVVPDKNQLCLIGRGDACKSTILEAIRRAFHPNWTLHFDDADFYNSDYSQDIAIEVVLTNLPDSFADLEKYGHNLSGWDAANQIREEDPAEGIEDALWIHLKVSEDLEPTWTVEKGEGYDGVPFKASDRALVSVSLVGTASDRNLTWTRGSVLGQLGSSENIASSLAGAARAARNALDHRRGDSLGTFDETARVVQETARTLGVGIVADYQAHLDSDAINVRTAGLALHEGDVPLRQLGVGSKRTLMTGLQQSLRNGPHITLFDEVELGLEPHRIARLLRHLAADDQGQYIMTTHSPVVIRELELQNLLVVHRSEGQVSVVAATTPELLESIQGTIRTHAEAFLAPRIIVCEGATEVGFLRGLDAFWAEQKGMDSFAYRGVALLDANGDSKISGVASGLRNLAYDVAVLADSDRPDQFSDSDAQELQSQDIAVFKWAGTASIEDRIFADLAWDGVIASIQVALDFVGDIDRLQDQVRNFYRRPLPVDVNTWVDEPSLRHALGKAANSSSWFKRQSRARLWAEAIVDHIFCEDEPETESLDSGSDLYLTLVKLRNWVDNA